METETVTMKATSIISSVVGFIATQSRDDDQCQATKLRSLYEYVVRTTPELADSGSAKFNFTDYGSIARSCRSS